MQRIKIVNQGDLLAFKASDQKYKVLLCTGSYTEKSPHSYIFAALTYNSFNVPTVSDILDSEFMGIGNRRSDEFNYLEVDLERMWVFHPEVRPYVLGSYGLAVWRKDFNKMEPNFLFVCNLSIVDHLDKNGSGGMNASSWDVLDSLLGGDFVSVLKIRGQRELKIRVILTS